MLRSWLVGLIPATYSYKEFKNDILYALYSKFGYRNVAKGNIAFNIQANSYRIKADVVPAAERRLYLGNGGFIAGTHIILDSGTIIVNWPDLNYRNGVEKNKNTNNRFKFITRVLKRLKAEMIKDGIYSAQLIPSFLLECLTYLVPNFIFQGESYKENIEKCISYLWDRTKSIETCSKDLEINGLKYLFDVSQKWRREEVNQFLYDAWKYIRSHNYV